MTDLRFRTYTGQRGINRTLSSPAPLLIGEAYGNLINLDDDADSTEVTSYVYAGGKGENEERIIGEATDATIAAVGPFSRVEVFKALRAPIRLRPRMPRPAAC